MSTQHGGRGTKKSVSPTDPTQFMLTDVGSSNEDENIMAVQY